MEFIRALDAGASTESGVTLRRLLYPETSSSERLTITGVTVAPGARNEPHRHASFEQVWVAVRGSGRLLLEGGVTMPFSAGDVVRFEENDLHGFENTGDVDFEYVSVTAPSIRSLSKPAVTGFDHVAIPTDEPERLMAFYAALGFSVPTPEAWQASGLPYFTIQFGENKINVHAPALWRNPAFTLRGAPALPGCGDFCFVWSGTQAALREALQRAGAPVEEGPVERVGARRAGTAKGMSLYTRDPDGNLLEFIVYGGA